MEPQIFTYNQIRDALRNINPVKEVEKSFVSYSQKQAIIPPVGELLFEKPPGEAHIKYGYIFNNDYYVIKIASGFYENIKLGLPVSNGLMLIFNQKTGELVSILLDEGYLTNVRTAAAGAVVAKYFAPKETSCIGIFGAGLQGRMQLKYIKPYVKCKDVMIWGISKEECLKYKEDMEKEDFTVYISRDSDSIAKNCNYIITATPSKIRLLSGDQVRKGTHITALGSDTPQKNELDPVILNKADILACDSLEQCKHRGEIYKAFAAGMIDKNKPVELGNVISGESKGRTSDEQISVVDLTGVAIQDIQISIAVYKALKS
jgi:ornithine cyclodeaminase